MTIEIREGRGVGRAKDHIHLHLSTSTRRLHPRAPARHRRNRAHLRRRRRDQGADPGVPTVHYNMGGIPTNYHGEVVPLRNGDPDASSPA